MAKIYERTSTRTMDPRPGVKYATVYNRVRPAVRRKMLRDIQEVMDEIVDQCEHENDYPIVYPLKGFPRTLGQENYSAGDIMVDLKQQLESGKDVPDAMIYRWNKLFQEFPELQIEFADTAAPTNQYGALFQ
jgi:hypothetical protein